MLSAKMVVTGTDGSLLGRVRAVLEGAQFAIVFGSFRTTAFGPGCDLDVTIQFLKPLSGLELVSLAGRLEEASRRCVDVADPKTTDPIIAMQGEDAVLAKVSTNRKCVATIRSLGDEIPGPERL